MFRSRSAAIAAALCVGIGAAGVALKAQSARQPSDKSQHVMFSADQLKWGPAPPSLPAGAQMAVLDGDPSQKGRPFVVRARFPDGFTVPPHWHPTDENLVVLSGTLLMGMGEKLDRAAAHSLGVGAYSKMPAGMRHYAIAKGDTVIQIHGVGPFEVTYVNPADDPRKKSTTTK